MNRSERESETTPPRRRQSCPDHRPAHRTTKTTKWSPKQVMRSQAQHLSIARRSRSHQSPNPSHKCMSQKAGGLNFIDSTLTGRGMTVEQDVSFVFTRLHHLVLEQAIHRRSNSIKNLGSQRFACKQNRHRREYCSGPKSCYAMPTSVRGTI
jgi:hypothetical protein